MHAILGAMPNSFTGGKAKVSIDVTKCVCATGVEGRFGITPVAGRVGGVILINRIVLYLQLL